MSLNVFDITKLQKYIYIEHFIYNMYNKNGMLM